MAFVKHHLPCPKCGGSDPVGLNDDGSAYCFSCNTYMKNYNEETGEVEAVEELISEAPHHHNTYSSGGEFYALSDRGISLETAKKYGVRSVKNHKGEIVEHSYPYHINHEQVTTKVRKADKTFSWTAPPKGSGLFGQQLFQSGKKYLTIVEGECDAMSAYEMLGSKWAVVSIKNGASGADRDIKENLEYIESFENVVICFDKDKVGEEASLKVARLLRPGKARIVNLPNGFKDANDMLRQGKSQDFVQTWWNAELYTPSGVLSVTASKERYKAREFKESIPYPWQGLNKKLEGMRLGELVTLTGGTGLGKSSITRELEHWLVKETTDNVGIIALEEDWRRTIDGILSIEANKRMHLDSVRNEMSDAEIEKHYSSVFEGKNEGRVWVHSHLGMNDIESIFSKLRFMIIGCDCKWIVVDHLHMLVLSAIESDERKAIDNIMHRLRTLVEETGCGMILVSHLRRVDGNKGHENGIETGLSHLRGSQSIAQLSDCVIGLERNQQSDDPVEASTTRVRVLKSRYTGDVGIATQLLYDKDTGRLKETEAQEDVFDELECEL
jgi:twinkle protein